MNVYSPLVQKYLRMIQSEGIDLAGIEYVEGANGVRYTYDINGTTNYNNQLGAQIGVFGMTEVAKFIKKEVLASQELYHQDYRSCG